MYDTFYQSKSLWNQFVKYVLENPKYQSEQDYFEEYNRVKDEAIDYIKSTSAYHEFNEMDMNQFAVNLDFRNLKGKDIFHPSNDGRRFISIDMRKANFSALRHYNLKMFNASSWESFIGSFTDNPHIIFSKYIRQVILGNCNPKRHITYEKWIMSNILEKLQDEFDILRNVVFFSNDEIVLDVSKCTDDCMYIANQIDIFLSRDNNDIHVPFRVEFFTLNKIEGTSGYMKTIHSDNDRIEFKCLDSYDLPFVIRKIKDEKIQDEDLYFVHQGRLAKFVI